MQQFRRSRQSRGGTTSEHQADEREREVTAALVGSDIDCQHLHLPTGIAAHLEAAADALLRASLILRDHILGEVMFVSGR
jgi:hypothetical protein